MMKKITCSIFAIALFTISIKAQEFKPNVGDMSAEVNFTPFSSSPIQLDFIKMRTFIAENQAFRVGILLNFEQEEKTDNDVDITNQTYEINIRPGYEKHFEGTDRLSPYIGIEMDLAYKDSESKEKGGSVGREIQGAWDEDGSERGFTRLGANILFGMDFYFAKRIYLGVEFGYGYQLLDQSKIKVKRDDYPGSQSDQDTSYSLGHNVNNAIRLGFNF